MGLQAFRVEHEAHAAVGLQGRTAHAAATAQQAADVLQDQPSGTDHAVCGQRDRDLRPPGRAR